MFLEEIRHRIGRFVIVPSDYHGKPFTDLMAIMGNFFIVDTRIHWRTGGHEYKAISPLFYEIEQGDEPPEYRIVIEDGEVTAVMLECEAFPYAFDEERKRLVYRSVYAENADMVGAEFFNVATGNKVILKERPSGGDQ